MEWKDPAVLDAKAELLRRLYLGEAWLEGVVPDLLGEYVVQRAVEHDMGILHLLVGRTRMGAGRDYWRASATVTKDQCKHSLTVLNRLAQRKPEASGLLLNALESNLAGLASSAVAVALETGDPIGRTLTRVIEQAAELPQEVTRLVNTIPEQTLSLSELAVALMRLGVENTRTDPARSNLARSLDDAAARLADLGCSEEALAAIEEAVDIRRDLAAVRPDAFQPELAISLYSLAGILSGFGRTEQARAVTDEAAELHRTLQEAEQGALHASLAASRHRLSDVPAKRAPLEELLRPAWEKLPSQVDLAPSMLLDARFAVVPFHGGTSDLTELELWCNDPAESALHLVVGAGGAGKTRLAVELCRRMSARGWLTGFLAEEADATVIDRLRELHKPALLVLDNAETRRPERLGALVQQLAATTNERLPLRLLLMARAVGEWWQTELPGSLRGPEKVLGGVSVRSVGPAAPGVDDRLSHYRTAMYAFFAAQGMAARDILVPDLGSPVYSTVLHLHMAALNAVGTPADTKPGSALRGRSPVTAMLEREGRFWRRSADAHGLKLQERGLWRAVAVATLFGAEDEDSAAAVLTRVPDLAGAPAEKRRDLARWYRNIYLHQRWLAPLQPGPLAEELVMHVLADSLELRRNGFRDLTPAQAERALTISYRAAGRRPQDLLPILREILASGPAPLSWTDYYLTI